MSARRSAEDRKQQIVETVIQLVDKVGPDRLTTDMVAKSVGITQPAIFRHFPKKENLWEAVAEHLSDMMRHTWQDALADSMSPKDQLHDLVMAHLKLIESTPSLPSIIFSRELHIENKTLRQSFFKTMNAFHKQLSDVVNRGIKEGAFRKGLDPNDAAFLLLGMVQSLAMRWSLSGRQIDLLETGERLLHIQLEGFA